MRRHWTLRLLWAYCLVCSVSLFRGGTCEGPPFYERGHRENQPGPSVGWLVRVLQGACRLFPWPVSTLGGWASVLQGVGRLFPWPVTIAPWVDGYRFFGEWKRKTISLSG